MGISPAGSIDSEDVFVVAKGAKEKIDYRDVFPGLNLPDPSDQEAMEKHLTKIREIFRNQGCKMDAGIHMTPFLNAVMIAQMGGFRLSGYAGSVDVERKEPGHTVLELVNYGGSNMPVGIEIPPKPGRLFYKKDTDKDAKMGLGFTSQFYWAVRDGEVGALKARGLDVSCRDARFHTIHGAFTLDEFIQRYQEEIAELNVQELERRMQSDREIIDSGKTIEVEKYTGDVAEEFLSSLQQGTGSEKKKRQEEILAEDSLEKEVEDKELDTVIHKLDVLIAQNKKRHGHHLGTG